MEIELSLHPSQRIVWKDTARYKVIVAGRRWGKTRLAVTELILSALTVNNSYLWLVSPTYKQSKMIAWRMLQSLIPQELAVKYNETELSVTFFNGSIIELRGCDNRDSLRGAGLNGLVIDEYASIPNNYAVFNEILRPALADKKGWIMFISTPKGKDSLYELYLKGQKEQDGYKSWLFKTTDNPFIDEMEIEEARKTTPERYFRQEYEATFEDFRGLVYPEFNEKDHVVEPHYVPARYPRLGSIDTAVTGITAVLKAYIDDDGTYVFYDEYYERDVRPSAVAEAIREDDITWYIDPASKSQGGHKDGKRYSLYDEYVDLGIVPILGENDVYGGISRVAEYFKSGKVKIFKTLTNTIYELERYHWCDEVMTVNGVKRPLPYKFMDHQCDNIKYLIASRTGAPLQGDGLVNPNSAWGRMVSKQRKQNEFIYK